MLGAIFEDGEHRPRHRGLFVPTKCNLFLPQVLPRVVLIFVDSDVE